MIVITGGAGFIGSALIWALNQRHESDILVVDHLGKGEKWRNLRGLAFADYLEKEDFRERVEREGPLPDMECIFHLGACSDTMETDCSYLVDNNFAYTKILATYALARGIRFIYASSAATYGDGAQGFSDREEALGELAPLNMYGYSKHLFDLWAQRQGLLDRLVGLKYFNVFGPNEYHKGAMKSFVVKGFEQIMETGVLRLFHSHRDDYTHGEQRRDFVYVKDVAAMTLFFLDHPDVAGIFNVGSGRARSWNDLARSIFHAMGRPVAIEYVDMPEALREKYQYHTQADMAKLRKVGYSSGVMSLEDAVGEYVREYLIPGTHLT